MIFADSHLHLFRDGYRGHYGRSPLASDVDVYEAFRARHEIAAGLVVGYEGEPIYAGNNAYIRSLARTRPWMTTLAFVHLSAGVPDVPALLDAGHAGIALYVADDGSIAQIVGWPSTAWQALRDSGAIMSLNIEPPQTRAVADIAKANAACSFLISHMGAPGTFKAAPPRGEAEARLAPLLGLAALPNVMVKISAPYAISDPAYGYPHAAAAPFADIILDRFGPDRCLWGSDFSPALDHVSFAQALWAPWLDTLDESARKLVAGQNLLRLLARRQRSIDSL